MKILPTSFLGHSLNHIDLMERLQLAANQIQYGGPEVLLSSCTINCGTIIIIFISVPQNMRGPFVLFVSRARGW